ncbi:carbon-nitrogen hydrolase family protein [Desulfogranum mediterraneum]|uniref:carbon-nitrogen hydrolase family protein n=1 Tax=Desulfogranum mediterraneum TaxID=160661 RepID=UPI001377CA00|nr:carbon-nitrogen hydrolase family protein [Desulfogranum mediterraneum]
MNNNFKISVAQISSVKGDVSTNIKMHLNAVRKAVDSGISYIVFPELSLTGYEPQLSAELAFSKNDPRLKPLTEAAVDYKIHIVAGAPLQNDSLPCIGEFIITPNGQIETYSKMNLHPGEEKYFSVGKSYHSVSFGKLNIFNAICADTNNPNHVEACVNMGASIYIAGVLVSADGYETDTQKLESYARKFSLLVAMANYNKPTGAWVPTGKSAIWGPSGLIAAADRTQNTLVVAENSYSGWKGATVEI